MKFRRIALPFLLLATAAFLFASCKDKPPVPGSPDPQAEEYAEDIAAAEDFQQALEDIDALEAPDGVVRGVLNADGLKKALADETNKILRLYGDEVQGDIQIEAADYTNRDFIFDTPGVGVVCDANVGNVTLTALNEDGFTLNGTAKTVLINGAGIRLTLNNSVNKLYVTARDAEVILKNGDFPVVYCDNLTDVISNGTDHAVRLILANGATREIPAGKTYTMETGKLTKFRG